MNGENKNLIEADEEVVFDVGSSTEWQRTFDHISDSIFIQDKNFTIIKANKATYDLLRLEEKDVIGKKCFEIFHKMDKPWKNCPFEKTRQDQKTHTEEVYDANLGIYLLVTTSPIFDEKGEFYGSVHIAKDISESKKFEMLLKKRADDNQIIIDSVPAMVFYKDKENRFIRTNKLFESSMSMTKEDLEGKSLLEIYPKEQAEAFWKDDLEVINSGEAKRNIIEPMQTRDGIKLVKTDKIPYFNEKGEVTGVIGFALDITESKKAEDKLKESRQRYATTLASIGDAVIATDNKGKITFVNLEAEKLTGWTMSEAIGKFAQEVFKIINEQTRQKVEDPVTKVLREKVTVGLANHTILIKKDGSEVCIDDSGAPIKNYDGDITGVVLVFRDISDKKKKEVELQQLNRILLALSNSNQLLMKAEDEADYLKGVCRIVIEDCGYKMTWIGYAENDANQTIRPVASAGFETGYLETLNLTWADRERGKGPTGTAIRTGEISMCENMQTDPRFIPWREEALKRGYASSVVFPLKDGEKTFAAISIYSKQPSPFSAREITLLKELANDVAYGITSIRTRQARISAEELLQKNIENLKTHGHKLEQITSELKKVQTAVENASDIIFITDDKGKIIYINKAIKNILGYKQKDLIGKKPNFWMEDMPNKFFAKMWQAIYFNKEPFIGEIQERKKDGDLFTAEIKISPVLDKNGKILSFVGIERDITEAKRLDNAKTEFISLAAHQLRTPITTVNLTAELLLGGLSGKMNKETKEHLQEIMDGVKKMSEMIELFLNVSRIEMKTFEVLPKASNIGKIIEENIKYVLPQINKKGIELRKSISKKLPIVDVDPNVMDIVLDNLLSNAIKYTPSRGVIKVEAEKEKDNLIIKVSDTGCGIPKKHHEKIFEKLFRAENMAQKVPGVGLGLYLCKALIEQSGGKIWLDSETNKGSTFFVSIPLNGMKINKRIKHS